MALTPEQKKVAGKIYRIGRKKGATRKELLSAIETGLVESGLRNLHHGDRDSQGWRQERAQFYKNPTNLNASVNRYFEETKKAGRGKGQSAGQLSQAVQRSAFPGRYDEQKGQAQDILKYLRRTHGGAGGGGGGKKRGGKVTSKRTRVTTTRTPGQSFGAERSALRQSLLTSSSGLPSTEQLLAYKRESSALKDIPGSTRRTRESDRSTRGGRKDKHRRDKPGKGGKGVQAGKDGWQGSKTVIRDARQVAKRFGMPIASEKRSTVNTASGNVSDHYAGNKAAYALDISTTSGHKAARRIARRYGMSYKPDVWNNKTIKVGKRRYRVQIGHGQNLADHADHIHVGVKRV